MYSSQGSEKVCAWLTKEGWRDVSGKSCVVGVTVFVCQTACGILMVTINLCGGDWWCTVALMDSYTRLVVFLKASTNNKAETMLGAFLEGVNRFGLPSRVRCDKGGENVLVSQYMLVEGQEEGAVLLEEASTTSV